jgi:YD repeat-containing protein
MAIRSRKAQALLIGTMLVLSAIVIPSGSGRGATVVYTYDQIGRVTSALYDNGLCITYTYDASGNRTAQTKTAGGGAPQAPTWGTGVWGCLAWTP